MESGNKKNEVLKKKKKGLNVALNVFGVIILCIITLLIFRNVCYREIYIIGNSMSPTLKHNEHGYMNITKNGRNNLSRLDIVVADATSPLGEKTTIIKRVIALEGETINIDAKTGDIKINQVLIDQKFISDEIKQKTCSGYNGLACDKEYLVPKNSVFVLGDNRGNTFDSETLYGAISKEDILGKLAIIFKECNDQQEACSLIAPRFY